MRTLDAKVETVISLLRQRPQIEEDISGYIDTQGGIEKIVEDEQEFTNLLAQTKPRFSPGGYYDTKGGEYERPRGYYSRPVRAGAYATYGGPGLNPATITDYRVTMRSALATPGVEHFILENRAIWNVKFEDQTLRLEAAVELNTNRVLVAIESRDGPWQSVQDPHVRETWKVEVGF